ncbi:sugar MFS transporter [Antarcticibacterium flavum]|uniref:Sugar MFS transporter n=1 Tax=Antarcticibacterium flavum TaxID=2058175 RepID=A0A5B7X4J4_9FLAO|nr:MULTISPECIES: sugar MFS transporter [Antarcticibacterium]MCM4160081.1 glucose/galactose MFS transporter [Antarcticibacterium sp. W02-3]QCY69638.1 sugar MFS transporter [Antarcticibacterium flavum]
MKNPSTTTGPATTPGETTRSIIIIGALFFIFGFVTWLNSVLIPYLKIACELNNFQSYFVVTAFYISYLVMALPSAWVLQKTGYKKGMSLGLIVMAVGAVIFIPAAYSRAYELFLLGLFVQGTGLALLQTASNPYVVVLGPAESAAKRISIMGICNKVAGVLAPIVLGAILFTTGDNLVDTIDALQGTEKIAALDELAQRVITPYLAMMAILLLLSALVYFSSLPEVDADAEDEELAKANLNKTSIFQFPHLFLGTFALFLYVGVEVIAGDTIISYANEAHGIPLNEAKFFASFTLGAMIVGYVIGIFTIPKYISQENALKVSAILGLLFGFIAIFGDGFISVMAIALLGIANALVWPAIWPMALAGLGRFTKVGSSFLIMAIAGGAILPPVYGYFADWDPQLAYWVLIPCYLYILFFATKGHTIGRRI